MTDMVTKMSTSQLLILKLLGIPSSDLISRGNNDYSTFLSQFSKYFHWWWCRKHGRCLTGTEYFYYLIPRVENNMFHRIVLASPLSTGISCATLMKGIIPWRSLRGSQLKVIPLFLEIGEKEKNPQGPSGSAVPRADRGQGWDTIIIVTLGLCGPQEQHI